MKRFEFRLERALKLKRQQQWLAEQVQRKAQADLDAARAVVARLQQQMTQLAALLEEKRVRSADAASWIAYQQQSVLIGQQIEAAAVQVRQAELKVAEANAARVRISTEVEALVHLREQQLLAYRREAARLQQIEVDEISLRRWMKNNAAIQDRPETGGMP